MNCAVPALAGQGHVERDDVCFLEDLVEGGELYFADRLIWGMKDGELRYVEALALEAEVVSEEAQ